MLLERGWGGVLGWFVLLAWLQTPIFDAYADDIRSTMLTKMIVPWLGKAPADTRDLGVTNKRV